MEECKGEPGAVVRDASAAGVDATGDAKSTADTGSAFFVIRKDWGWENGCSQRYWIPKIARNRQRDEEVNKKLLFEGWTVIRFWGKDIQKNLDACVKAIEEVIFEIKMEPEEISWEDMEDEIGK